MKGKIWILLLVATMLFVNACQKKKEPEKKETTSKVSGYVINFKANDVIDLVPAKTIILLPGPRQGENQFSVNVVAKSFDQITQASFEITFDPAMAAFQSFNPGTLMEEKGKVEYKVGPVGDQKGRLEVKLSLEAGKGAAGSGTLVTLLFKGLKPGRGDILLEKGELMGAQKKKVAEVNFVSGMLWILETS
jgi:hypothetical protein